MYSLKHSAVAFAGLFVLIGAIALVIPRPTVGQKAEAQPTPLPPPLNVNVVNTPLPVTGTVNVGNTVQTQTALPSDAFSVVVGPRSLILGPDPEGTKYAVTSLTVANSGDTLVGVRLSASLSDGSGGPENTGPVVIVPAGQSVHLSFPQPFVLSAPPGGDSYLKTESASVAFGDVTVVGYRF